MKKTDHVFVIDTNTLISAFILPDSVSGKAVNKAIKIGHIVFSRSTNREFADVFIRSKFDKYLPLEVRVQIINNLKSLVIFVQPRVEITASRDKKDNQFLELAVAAKASCIISGDKDLLVLHPFQGIPIINASDFFAYQFT
ncbi:putative toxin-antitoxin system toxin component, PIN family [uncultured Mucilaginibacter sp.]|uniref:putative toxin-antitoxin system toxin component, PIN family n=1 Tax=uncultured Mucilaginibacter sp. TaxID=797541 RepID=UPI0025F33116|nr:putative toxin-antitoxin system toxin component, PIN family [uncultured Mucilaginibacter sp.]